jgi:hypothetical protein
MRRRRACAWPAFSVPSVIPALLGGRSIGLACLAHTRHNEYSPRMVSDGPRPGWRPSVACVAAGLAVWVAATLLIATLFRHDFGSFHQVVAYLVYSAASTFVPCICIGIPSTAVALWLRIRRPPGLAIGGGLAVAAVGFAILVIAFGAGTAAVTGIAPMLLILAAEFWLAFRLRLCPRTRISA